MPRQARKWTDEQREAMAQAILDERLPAKEAKRQAAAGTLREGLGPFDPPISTIRDAASKEQRRRTGDKRSKLADETPAAALLSLWERLIGACDVALARLERQANSGKASPDDLRLMAKTIASLGPVTRELRRNAEEERATPAPPATKGKEKRAKAPRTLADSMLEDQRKDERGGVPSNGYAHTHIGNADQSDLDSDSGDAALASLPTEHEATEHARADSPHAHDSGHEQPALRAAEALRARMAHA